MSVSLSLFAGAGQQFFTDSGIPLSGGLIYTYQAGTTTPQAAYTSISGATAHTNPIILDSAGRVPAEIWLTDGVAYKFILKDSNDVLIGTYDNIPGQNTFVGDVSFTGNLTVGGNTNITGNANITGDTNIAANLDVTGNTNINGNLNVVGAITSAGAIAQIVNSTTITPFTTTSGTYVSTGHTATITPTSATSKILILLTATLASQTTNTNTNLTISRNGTVNLAGGGSASFADTLSSAGNIYASVSVVHYDSPGSTGAQIYRVDILTGGTAYYNSGGSLVPSNMANLVLMEILQ